MYKMMQFSPINFTRKLVSLTFMHFFNYFPTKIYNPIGIFDAKPLEFEIIW